MLAQDGLDLDPKAEDKRIRDVEKPLEADREPDEAHSKTEEEAQQTRMRVTPADAEDERQKRGAHYPVYNEQPSIR